MRIDVLFDLFVVWQWILCVCCCLCCQPKVHRDGGGNFEFREGTTQSTQERKGSTTATNYPFDVQFEKVSRCFPRIPEYVTAVSPSDDNKDTVLLALATTVIDSEVVLWIGFMTAG